MIEILKDEYDYSYTEIADGLKITRVIDEFEFGGGLHKALKFQKGKNEIVVDVSGNDEEEQFILFIAANIFTLQSFGYTDGFENTNLFNKDNNGFLSRYSMNDVTVYYNEDAGFKIADKKNSILMGDEQNFTFNLLEALFALKSN